MEQLTPSIQARGVGEGLRGHGTRVTVPQREAQLIADGLWALTDERPNESNEIKALRDRFRSACGF
jgi:hypothetical protein